METEGRKRMLYSAPVKVTATVLLFLGALLCAVFGSTFLRLAAIGSSSLASGVEENCYYETSGCATSIYYDLVQLSNYLAVRKNFDVEGHYDPERLVDVTLDYRSARYTDKDANRNTSYTLDDMYTMYATGFADTLSAAADEAMNYVNQQYSYEYSSGDAAEAADEETVSSTVVRSPALNGNSAEIITEENLEEIALSYMSEDTWHHLQSVARTWNYSRQFLYLYGIGYPMEVDMGILTVTGSTLADYAAANPDQVSLVDLYHGLPELSQEVADYIWAVEDPGLYLNTNSNLRYYVTDGTHIYTNTPGWEGLSEGELSRTLESWPMYLEYTRVNNQMVSSYFPETAAGYQLSVNLPSMQLLSGNETVFVGLDTTYPVEDSYKEAAKFYDRLAPNASALLAVAIIGLVLAIVALLVCTVQAGRNQEDEQIRLYGFDTIPTELAAGIGVVLGIFVIGYFGYLLAANWSRLSGFYTVFLGLYVCLSLGLFLLFYLSLVRRIKVRNLWEKSIVRAVMDLWSRAYEARKESTRLIIAGIGLILIHFIFLPSASFFGILLCLVVDILVLLYMLREAAGRQNVIEGLRRMGSGDLDYKVDTAELNGNSRELADVVNSMGDSLKTAMDVRMKNERMQADLITNVSHDIKTPLTSIVNYVDLLKRENIEDPKVKGYIDILERKSQRLKQLTEDLVEASKVSSGNVKMEFVTLNLNELVQQVNGEFDERLAARELQMICTLPQEPALVKADSRYLWRVIENLYGNVAKYAMPGTRVYVEVSRENGEIFFVIKNISEQTLNISPDELMERFVRGDKSRTTEGSGLGLSIAENLVKLMQGRFKLFVDGDLFKAQIAFPEIIRINQ